MSSALIGACWEAIATLRNALFSVVERELKRVYGADEWWEKAVAPGMDEKRQAQLRAAFESRRKNVLVPFSGGEEEMLDVTDLSKIIERERSKGRAFKEVFPKNPLPWIQEVIDVRNSLAHPTREGIPKETAYRVLDNCRLILERTDKKAAAEIAAVRERLDRPAGTGALRPWREVAVPHRDVSSGKYRQAEFAADLAQVAAGKGTIEYKDPKEFFRRTYLTEGISALLAEAAERLSGKGGEPVVKLQTSFGGGKTHTMIALYHLFNGGGGGGVPAAELEGAPEILRRAGLETIPAAKTVVFVGTDKGPSETEKIGRITARTLWGRIAARLGPAAYEKVRDADEKGVSPGAGVLADLFDEHGPVLLLVDEWVRFLGNIFGVSDLPAGSFDANITFVQTLTEAVKRSERSMLVASLPTSDAEAGGAGGKQALQRLEHIFARVEAIWKPVGTREAFEVVRRRLFSPITDEAGRDETCRAFAETYARSGGDFPPECAEGEYVDRLRAAYPVHPEVFDRLYHDWATLESFQRTRGVLRLMAAAIHRLWADNDRSPLILPGTIPLEETRVRDELTRYLSDGWNGVVETDVDGEGSEAWKLDHETPRFGKVQAARRVMRTIFLGSAPHGAEQQVRGVEEVRVRLGCAFPGEAVSDFTDALGRLSGRLTHLYSDERKTRYWLDTKRNLLRTVNDRAEALKGKPEVIDEEILERLRAGRDRGAFRAVHACVAAEDIPDADEVRLVALPLSAGHRRGRLDSEAVRAAAAILETRGGGPRRYRNMVLFVAPDDEAGPAVKDAVRLYLAWKSVNDEADPLNLDTYQRNRAKAETEKAGTTLGSRLQEAYAWLLVPAQEDGAGPVSFAETRIAGGKSYIERATDRVAKDEGVIAQWSPAGLRVELDKWFWKDADHVSIKKVWESLATYCYLPRLADREVFLDAVREGLRGKDYFGYATSVAEKPGASARYEGLAFGDPGAQVYIDDRAVLVKPEAAARQMAADEAKAAAAAGETAATGAQGPAGPTSTGPTGTTGPATGPIPPAKPRRFHASISLEAARLGRDASRIADEVVSHLAGQVDTEVEVTLEITATSEAGFPETVVRTVSENCKTLKFKAQEFEKE